MKRLVLGILAAFFTSALSAALIFLICGIVALLIAKALLGVNVIIAPFPEIWKAFLRTQGYAIVIFASVVTAVLAYITLQVIQRQQRLTLRELLQIFKSFVWTTVISVCIYQIMLYFVAFRDVQFELFGLLVANFYNVVLPLTWLIVAFYWIRTYRSRFLNDSEEWMLK
jgi:hypothetical protein